MSTIRHGPSPSKPIARKARSEAFYFCIVTLTTVGFGDLSPTTPGTQIFTVVYILTGFRVLVALLTSVAQQYLKLKAEAPSARDRVRARRGGPAV